MAVACIATAAIFLSFHANGQTASPSWKEREPLHVRFGNEPTSEPAQTVEDASYLPPPDPNSQIPLTGFDWMLLASFAFGAWYLVRHREVVGRRER